MHRLVTTNLLTRRCLLASKRRPKAADNQHGHAEVIREYKLPRQDVDRAHLCDGPADHVVIEKGQLLSFLRQMLTIRRMEMAADALYKERAIRGFCHLSIGQVSSTLIISP